MFDGFSIENDRMIDSSPYLIQDLLLIVNMQLNHE